MVIRVRYPAKIQRWNSGVGGIARCVGRTLESDADRLGAAQLGRKGENCGWSKEKAADGLGGVSGLCKLLREWPIECNRVRPCVSVGAARRPMTNPRPARPVKATGLSVRLLWSVASWMTCWAVSATKHGGIFMVAFTISRRLRP